jgi:hypothetical protein
MVAVVLFILVGVFPYLLSGLLVPTTGLVVLMFFWGVGFAFTARTALRRPLWALAAVPLALAFWWLYVSVGSALFGWTA